ncbi:MAG TPA: hypothetical protein VGF20_09010 [Candidatus Acidoferrum sp.]|jgi:hypothetical protein
MRIRFSLILPVLGLLLFAVVTYRSMAANPEAQGVPNKYYWWSSLRLDTDPLNQKPRPDPVPSTTHMAPGWLDRLLTISALPAFLAGSGLVIALSKQGVDEVLTFLVSMPILVFAWFYLVGWLLDLMIVRWMARRAQSASTPLKLT